MNQSSLTDSDREVIRQARELSRLIDGTAVRLYTGEDDATMAYAVAFGEAQHVLAELAHRLEDPDDDEDQADDDEDLAAYCTACGAALGLFLGYHGWHHFTGSGTVEDPNQLFGTDHEPVVAWRPAGAR